jgi:hypothetical protein
MAFVANNGVYAETGLRAGPSDAGQRRQDASAARPWATLLLSVALGALAGLAYALLVGGSYVVLYGRWGRVPTLAAGSIITGAVLGLVVGAGLVFAGLAQKSTSRRLSGEPGWGATAARRFP